MPWTGKGCQVEVDELELLLAPCSENDHLSSTDEPCSSNADGKDYNFSNLGKFSNEMSGSPGNPDNVHEGVKTIARMVKWFLTSFNVKIKRLIVAFDPSLEKGEKLGFHRTLVLRISETECGTCVSEDGLGDESRAHSFLGISQLINFVKFHGAAIELLQMQDVDDQSCASHTSGTPLSGLYSHCSPPNDASIPIISGKGGGFSGNLKLSIPWKNGSLDIRKVDADVSIDPVDLRFQPSIIKWLLLSWETCKNFDKDGKNGMHCETTDSIYLNSNSQFQSSAHVSAMTVIDDIIENQGRFSAGCTSLNMQESVDETGLPGSHFIPNWVPISVGKNKRDPFGEEVDFGASVDQFFECFEGMRNSQSALGNSGMWNWTCSVFSAITAASRLASGSLLIPSEQQHIQTNLKVAFAGISIVLSFHDEDLDHLCDPIHASSSIHHLGIECRDISVLLQKFDIWPIVVRVDYSPHHVDLAALKGGKYEELVNIVPWKGVELELKHVHSVGIYGWGSVCETIIGEWLEDISQNQIHKVLRGLPTIPSLVAVGAAAAKLVSLPLESYRKDQRVLKGMQRGTMAFLRSISLEAVGLGVHLAAGTCDFLFQAEYMFTNSPAPVSRPSQGKLKTKTNVRHNPPKDAQQGIQQAYESFSNGLGKSASALVQAPLKKYHRGASASSALATAVKALPTAAIAPASGCASAIHCALLGIRNSLDPERKKESMEKYFGPSLPQDPN